MSEHLVRDPEQFGTGSFVGEIMQDDGFFEQDARDQARFIGWADGCPVVEELTDPANPNPGRGPEAMVKRYAEVNLWFTYVTDTIAQTNPQLAEQMRRPLPRLASEPAGHRIEPESIPDSFQDRISPMGQLAGFAAPRLFSAALAAAGEDKREKQKALAAATEAVELASSTEVSENPLEFLAAFSQNLLKSTSIDTETVLKTVLGKGWLDEQNSPTTITSFKMALEAKAPALWEHYTTFDQAAKEQLGIL